MRRSLRAGSEGLMCEFVVASASAAQAADPRASPPMEHALPSVPARPWPLCARATVSRENAAAPLAPAAQRTPMWRRLGAGTGGADMLSRRWSMRSVRASSHCRGAPEPPHDAAALAPKANALVRISVFIVER